MKSLKFALLGCTVFVGAMTFAQETTEGKEHPGKHEAMLEQLKLTEDQKVKIDELQEAHRAEVKALKMDSTIAEADLKAKVKELRADQKEKISEILTEEQRAELKELKAAYKEENQLTPGEIALKQTEKMNEMLDLTEEQLEKVRNLNLMVANKIDAIRKNENMTDERKKEFIAGNRKDHKRALQTILTEEQFQKYEAHLAERKEMRKQPKEMPSEAPSKVQKASE